MNTILKRKGGDMKHFFRLILCMFVLFFFQFPVLGADATKIGVVDIQKFQQNSRAFQKSRGVLKQKFDAMQRKLDEEKRALIKIEEEFKKQSMMLSLDAREDKKKELEKKRRYYKYLYEDFTEEWKDAEIDATKKIVTELEKVFERIGDKEGYLLIIRRKTPGLIYYKDTIDITDRVTEAYDRMKQ